MLDLQSYWKECLRSMAEEINITNAKTEADFTAAPVVLFNRSYLKSLFLNLLSNSLKFKSSMRSLKIKVWSFIEDEHVIIIFSDNGAGIDLEKHGEKFFVLHQRFHPHIGGKGTGLCLIKAQISSFDGNIEVKSKLDKGTDFIVKLKH